MGTARLSLDPRNHAACLAEVQSVLSSNQFENADIGDLNGALQTDYWILTIPKCSTTSIQRGLERLGRRAIHAHTNRSTYEAFPNGSVLKDAGVGMEHIVRARLESSSRKIHYFFGYREPVAWWKSLAGQFSLDYSVISEDHVTQMAGDCHPWNMYSIHDMAKIAKNALGIELQDEPFDHDRGVTVIGHDRFNVILYRSDRMSAVEAYIQQHIDERFLMRRERVNVDPAYIDFKHKFRPERAVVETLYDDPWCRYFYTSAELDQLLDTI